MPPIIDRIKKLAEQARLLTPDERADLIDELLSMAPEPMPGWDKAWSEEAARRWKAFAESGTDAYAWRRLRADSARDDASFS
jgi:hypothetical protein